MCYLFSNQKWRGRFFRANIANIDVYILVLKNLLAMDSNQIPYRRLE